GGESISATRLRPWLTHPHCHAEVANTYGPTECTDICGFYRLSRSNLDQYAFVPLGRPIRNVQMAIVDAELQLRPIGEPGELCVGGAGVGAGYINDEELTRSKFVEHSLSEISSRLLYRTGDQARWHHDGVVEFLGRLDHQVKIRGHRIELPEIERTLETHPSVKEAIVVVLGQDERTEPQLVACCTFQGGANVSTADLRCHVASKLPGHMVPHAFELLASLPLSPNGKVDRKKLAERVQKGRVASAVLANSGGAGLESQIQAVWCELLGREQAGLDDNFFDVGGDSLRLARLHQQLEGLLQRKFPITELFARPTIRGMVELLNADRQANEAQQRVRERARLQRQAMGTRLRPRG
ncbi:MAG: non-ribosomal peptide synthetase, partial [Pirellulaceae bacterium]